MSSKKPAKRASGSDSLGNGALRVSPTEWRRELSTAALEIEEYIDKYKHR